MKHCNQASASSGDAWRQAGAVRKNTPCLVFAVEGPCDKAGQRGQPQGRQQSYDAKPCDWIASDSPADRRRFRETLTALKNAARQFEHRRCILLATRHMHDAQDAKVPVRPFERYRQAFADSRQFLERQFVDVPFIVD